MSEVVIVGAAESERLGVVPDQSAMSLAVECSLAALGQAGLTISDVDGVTGTMSPIEIAFAMGAKPRWIDGTMVGGCSYMLHIRHAVAAIRAGQADVVVIAHGESGRSRIGAPAWAKESSSLTGQFEMPYGVLGSFTRFTLPVMAYLDRYGLGEADLAEVSVAQSRWANRNPRALRPKLLTVDDVLASPLIAWPFHQLECCPVTDGGGALVLTSRERAADLDLAYRPVTIAGSGESCEGPGPVFMEELHTFRAFREASAEALRTAGLSHSDIDHLMIYDAFAHVPLYGLEDIGFVGRGEAVDFIRSGATSPGGRLPTNTNGGEAVRQLQGRAAAQTDAPRTSFVLGAGGMFSAAGAVVLRAY